MMVGPEGFAEEIRGKGLGELVALKDELSESAKGFEVGRRDDSELLRDPSPEVVYQMELLYLAKVCELLSEEYNRTVVWGIATNDGERRRDLD